MSVDAIVWAYTAAVAALVAWAVIHHAPFSDYWAPLLMVGVVQYNYWRD